MSDQEFGNEADLLKLSHSYDCDYNLRIVGNLSETDRKTLSAILQECEVSFDEARIYEGFKAGVCMIPGISAYVGVRVIQTLKDSPATFELLSSQPEGDPEVSPTLEISRESSFAEPLTIPILRGEWVQGYEITEWLEELENSVLLPGVYLSATKENHRMESAIQRLKSHLQTLAKYRKAHGVLRYDVEITPILHRQETLVLARGTPVRWRKT